MQKAATIHLGAQGTFNLVRAQDQKSTGLNSTAAFSSSNANRPVSVSVLRVDSEPQSIVCSPLPVWSALGLTPGRWGSVCYVCCLRVCTYGGWVGVSLAMSWSICIQDDIDIVQNQFGSANKRYCALPPIPQLFAVGVMFRRWWTARWSNFKGRSYI